MKLLHQIGYIKSKISTFAKCFLLLTYKKTAVTTFFFSLLTFFYLGAQVFPVEVNQNLIPPYNTKLSSYATSTDTKLNLQLLLRDINITNRQVRLKLYIEGNGFNVQSTPVIVGAPMIFLNGGSPQFYTNVDLRAYFEQNNLVGITPQQYSRSLPDGVYNVCWEVYDFMTNLPISRKTCTPVYILQNDPPVLNLPQRAESIVEQNPLFINFQWTPRHVNATNVSYEFELREIWDNYMNPQAAFLASPNYYRETTFGTTLLYDMSKPTLLPGKRYAWRVRAISTSGISENAVFKNNGYSEIFYFTYSADCAPPLYALSEALSAQKVKLTWQGAPNHNKYHIQYKKANIEEAQWFEVFTYNNQAQVSNLEPGATYDFRVGGTCNLVTDLEPSYTYSSINQFTMPTKDEAVSYNCGVMPEIEITNTSPLSSLGMNETFTAGDFEVTVKLIEGANGTFSGTGFIVVPYLADTKIAVEFQGIKINTDYQLYDGVINTIYDPNWSGVEDIGDLTNGGTGAGQEVTINFPIDSIDDIQIDPNGDIIITGSNGQQLELAGGEDYVITDNKGNQYAVDEEGNVSELGQEAQGGKPTPENTNGVNQNGEATELTAEGITVTFTKADDTKYGFDAYNSEYSNTQELYKKLGTDYYIPYKAVKNGNEDYIIAHIDISDTSIVADSLVFKTQDGTAIEVLEKSGNQWKLKVTGYQKDALKQVLATIKQDDKHQVAGAFNLYHLEEKQVDVVLVNTNNANKQAIEQYLNQVYQQAVVKVTIVQEITDFTITPNAEGKIDSGESGFAANYTQQQQEINENLRSRADYNSNAYYLITTDLQPSTTGEKGLMPLGRQLGYIFGKEAHTLAHELGHGAFKLKHPFSDKSYGWTRGTTNWLMDYTQGEHLPYIQWQEIHNPNLRIGIFDSDSEGKKYNIKDLLTHIKENTGNSNYSINFIKDYKWESQASGDMDSQDEYPLSSEDWIDLDADGVNEKVWTYIKVSGEEKNYFTLNFNDVQTKEVFKLKVYDFNTFEKLLSYLGMSLKETTLTNIVTEYNQEITQANGNCNQLDYLFEAIGETVSEKLSDQTLWSSLVSLSNCNMGENIGTKEETAAINLLRGFTDYQYLYDQLHQNQEVVYELYRGIDGDNAYTYLNILAQLTDYYGGEVDDQQLRNFCYLGYNNPNNFFTNIDDINNHQGNKHIKSWMAYPTGGIDVGVTDLSDFKKLNLLDRVEVYKDGWENRDKGYDVLPVIYIHHLAQKESQEEFLQALNYASTFLGIYGSSRILFTKGAGYLAKAIAFTELANLTMSLYMQNEANVNYIRSIGSEGEWFVNNWMTISIATDLTTFSTSFLTNLSRNAGKVSQKIRVKGATQEADELEDLIKSSGTVLEKRSKVLSMGNIGAKYPINDFEGFVENTFTITQKERFHKAKEFYKSFNSDSNVNELRGIDFDSNVSNILKQEDNVMYQLATIDKNTGKPRVGQYFFENIDDDVSKLGIGDLNRIKADKRVKIKVIFDEGVNFLKSKTADIEDWTGSGEIFKGGGTQYYSSTAKTKIKSYEIIEVY